MRILITLKGNILIKEIDDLENNSNNNNTPLLKRYKSNPHNLIRKIPKINKFYISKQKNLSKNSINSFTPRIKDDISKKIILDKNDSSNTSFDLNNKNISLFQTPKIVKLHHKKLSFPKQFSDKYEKDTSKATAIIDSNLNYYMPSIPLKTNPHISSFSDKNRYYSFNDIIPSKNILEMRKKIIKENEKKIKEANISDYNYRDKINSEINLEKFNNLLLTPKIKSTKLGLIKYLNEKKIGPKVFKSLYNKDNIKINKLNEL